MLEPLMAKLAGCRIVLASSSPRRRQILEAAGLKGFEVIPSSFEETVDKSNVGDPGSYVLKMACGKAEDVENRLTSSLTSRDLIIAADTIVYLNNRIFEKPKDSAEAEEMLKTLSSRVHVVYSGVCVISRDQGNYHKGCFFETTEVTMGVLPDSVIKAYVATGDPLDKAGAYGIQSNLCSSMIKSIKGSYDNVVGFPTHSFCLTMYDIFGTPH